MLTKQQFKKLLKDIASNTYTDSVLRVANVAFYDVYDDEEAANIYRLTDDDAAKLAKALKKNQHIINLDLSHNNIGDRGVAVLLQIPTLQGLNLTGNKITPIGAELLAKSSLLGVSISENDIQYSPTKHLIFQKMMDAFSRNGTILKLDLSYCDVPNQMLADLISRNKTLSALHIGGPNLSDNALESVKSNNTLKELYVYQNKLTNFGAISLSHNHSLQVLDIDESLISDDGAFHLSQNPILQVLFLRESNVTKTGAAYFYQSNIKEVHVYNGAKPHCMSSNDIREFEHTFSELRHVPDTTIIGDIINEEC